MFSTRTARIGFFATTLLLVTASLLATSALATPSAVSHSLQLKFEAIDVPVIKASSKWTSTVGALPTTPSSSQLDGALGKVSPAYDAALKTFDAALQKLMLPGAAGTTSAAIVKEDHKFETLLANTHITTSQFESQFKSIFTTDITLADQFKSAMSLQADSSLVV